MNRIASSPEPTASIKPIHWSNLIDWAKQTAIEDRRRYRTKPRAMTLQRLWGTVFPNLRQPIFIVGSPRSGTTFLGSCIATIPEISYHFEPVATKAAARYVHEGKWNFTTARWFYRSVYRWLMRLHFDGDLRFAEKTPRNCFLIDFLAQAFPEAQFIHIVRNGRDAALSHSKKPWLQAAAATSRQRESSGYLHGPYARFWVEPERRLEFETTSDIHRCIWAWRQHTEAILKQVELLPQSRYHELRYEGLVKQPQLEADRLLEFLHIRNSVSQRSLHQAFARARPDSVGAWQRELSATQLQQIETEAGTLLRRLGY